MKPTIYVMGSLRNPVIPEIGNALRGIGFDVFDDWFAGGPEADDKWKEYEQRRGRTYADALKGHFAINAFEFDRYHLERCGMGLLVVPAGKSAHIEFGFMIGCNKPTFVLFPDGEPPKDRWDMMYQFATTVFFSIDEMFRCFNSRVEN